MAISVDLRDLDPMHYITAERVASMRKALEGYQLLGSMRAEALEADPAVVAEMRVLLMALEQLTGLDQ